MPYHKRQSLLCEVEILPSYKIQGIVFKGNVTVYKDLNSEFVTKNSFCHEFAARKCFELSRAQRARSLVNCILSLFCRLYLLGELSEDGQVSIMW